VGADEYHCVTLKATFLFEQSKTLNNKNRKYLQRRLVLHPSLFLFGVNLGETNRRGHGSQKRFQENHPSHIEGLVPQTRQSDRLSLQSYELAPPAPSPASECCPPLGQFRTKGQTLW
jgi:hypothetical protein